MVAQVNVNDVYTNLSGLNEIKAAGRKDSAAGLKQVAKQFESLFINMMLKTMRDSNKVFSEGNYLSSNEMDIHQQNFDNQLSLHLSSGDGIGLADVLHRQLMQQYDAGVNPGTNSLPSQFDSPADFVSQVLPYAKKAAEELGIQPEFLVAQSALESGWGSKVATDSQGASSNNLFGIKADRRWDGPVASSGTIEFDGGVAVRQQAKFRKYDSLAESFSDYVKFLQSNPRYSNALDFSADSGEFAAALQEAGYATDPAYGDKIKAVMGSQTMHDALSASENKS